MSLRNRSADRRPDGHSSADSEALAAYLLNALEPEQRSAVHRHLQDCDSCYLEYTSLAVLPDLLDTLSLEDVRKLTAPEPPALRPTRAQGTAAPRPHRLRPPRLRASLLAGGAFSAAMVATGFLPTQAVAAVQGPAVPGEPARHAGHEAEAAPAVEFEVTAVPAPGAAGKTRLQAEVRSEVPMRECLLQVTTADGEPIPACRFDGAPSTRVMFSGDIPLAAGDIRSVEVLAPDGTALATHLL
jgi:anti-sigma factor RsiW